MDEQMEREERIRYTIEKKFGYMDERDMLMNGSEGKRK
jgi:hypothetical protein